MAECSGCGVEVKGKPYTENIDGKMLVFCCKHCADIYKKNRSKKKEPDKRDGSDLVASGDFEDFGFLDLYSM